MTEQRPLRWDESDLDRCEHGRHSTDSCFDCPGGRSMGNRYLVDSDGSSIELNRTTGEIRVRIGTTYDSRAIVVCPVRERTITVQSLVEQQAAHERDTAARQFGVDNGN